MREEDARDASVRWRGCRHDDWRDDVPVRVLSAR